jgi:uncharacterized protein with PIN domain
VTGFLVWFRFHGELSDFLSPLWRDLPFKQLAGTTDTIKHVVESLGVPHTEVGYVTVNGKETPSSERFQEGDHVEVFPHVKPVLLAHPRFVLDGHLGRLAAYLRMLGFDTWYNRCVDDTQLAAVASGEERLLMTRDVGLLKRREVEQGYCVRSHKPHDQLREVSSRFALRSHFAPFCRCMDCNGPLCPVPKEAVADQLPPHTRETKNEFSRCGNCGKVFWRGSHYARMLGWIEELTASL